MKKHIIAAVLGGFLASGCSTLMSESAYAVKINSNPTGASFSVANEAGQIVDKGKTPRTVTLEAGNGYFSGETYTVKFSMDGYESQNFIMRSTMDGWYVGNILIGGLLGMLVIDPLTGAMWKLPDSANVNLNTLTVTTIDQLNPEQIEQLEAVE